MSGLPAVFVLGLLSSFAPPDWPTLIADAQAMNKGAWRQGRLRCDVTFKPRADQAESKYQVRMSWSEDRFLLRYKAFEPNLPETDVQEVDRVPLEKRPDYLVLSNGEGLYHFNPYGRMLSTFRPGTQLQKYWLQVHPYHTLLRRCPPMMNDGRTWIEMLTFIPVSEAGESSTIKFERIDDDIVMQTRTDPGAGRLEIRYSMMKAKGNVVDSQYIPEGDRHATEHTTLEWKPVGESVMVESIETRSKLSGGKRVIDSFYRVDVLDASLEAQEESQFSTEAFFKLIPGGTKVVDREKSVEYRLPATPASVAKKADDLVERVRARGYLKKP